MGPARMFAESLTPRPGIREQNRHISEVTNEASGFRLGEQSGLNANVAETAAYDPNQTSDASGSCRMARVPADGLPRIPRLRRAGAPTRIYCSGTGPKSGGGMRCFVAAS